ncbi:STAS domain-containing protein [Lentzea sp. NEAU-D7]|uniref:STAS domain-containing protein n=1 Tax=Lentzea sp. NEAU-D7 TaxID=2994667 RepID=UPI00224AD656|nr:STAS domain-containing protein [Lentzea sp. NEAU-D7]MCX2952783.1 STAS domain-containing protein [Lentzea sp. NEAU-D7]
MHEDVEKPLITVEVDSTHDVVIVAVHGDVDHETFQQIRDTLFTRIGNGAGALVVDLDDVGFFGSIGIAVLLEARQRADQLGVRFAVVAGRRAVIRPIRSTDTQDLLRVQRTRAEALAAVRRHCRYTGHLDDPTDTGFVRSWP